MLQGVQADAIATSGVMTATAANIIAVGFINGTSRWLYRIYGLARGLNADSLNYDVPNLLRWAQAVLH